MNLELLQAILDEIKKLNERIDKIEFKKEWLTENETMELLDISKKTIQNYRREMKIPFSQERRKIYFKYSDLTLFLEERYNG